MAKVPQRCGWRTKAGKPCTLRVSPGTSRCWRHQGEWTGPGKVRRIEEELKKAKQELAKSRRK
ncbi:hypothetical protein GCM10010507_01740 [Streptomyces cinnamoneus]|uniref:Uncharacterized protein n=1 Tax=Streptomyces cinnamoneus TaxID=53446 RepID=A0A918T976_STRCJ|nr:hypothetical protein GCM10010507_01740 [Streptomyces cinnamoneus]